MEPIIIDGGTKIVPFLAKLDLDAARDARGARRLLAHRLNTLLVGDESRFDIIIHNMSETGFLAEFSSDLQVGDIVRVQVARFGFVAARVVWKRGQGHGCEFVERIPVEVIEETIAASVRFGPDQTRRFDSEQAALDAEEAGRRRREKRDQAGAMIMLVCVMLAIAILAAALIRVVF